MSTILWSPTPAQIQSTNLWAFGDHLRNSVGLNWEGNYQRLHTWSLENSAIFWRTVWDFCQIQGDPGSIALLESERMIDARWFPEGSLNFAQNLLRADIDPTQAANRTAIVEIDERGQVTQISRQELYRQVTSFAQFLRDQNVQAGDRIAAVLPNSAASVIAMLGSVAIGAVWSSCSPDFGDDAIVDRFSQIAPKFLVTQTYCQYNGKKVEPLSKVRALLDRLPSVQGVIVSQPPNTAGTDSWREATREFPNHAWWDLETTIGRPPEAFEFPQFPFQHPLCIVYSSGTTGAPKCIVHSAGGALLQHAKELQLHSDLRTDDRLMYFTTTGWMMWNWLVSGLQANASIVLYDGSPLYPQVDSLFQIASNQGVTHFGASAKYFAAIEKEGCRPKEKHDLRKLRVILSTGSPLLPESFEYIYRDIQPNVQLASISGGTDILSCFVLGQPTGPVHCGEIQCAGLGMDVRIYDDQGHELQGQAGELVCTAPFPSMPIGFWNDPDCVKYQQSYFDRFENVWCHGDWAQTTSTNGFIIFGRSDATLNPGGVRIGTAEIYRQVEAFDSIAESLATAYRSEGDEQIVLFVRMKGSESFSSQLEQEIRQRLRQRCSPRHVPKWIIATPDLPRTISGKLSELAVRNAIHGLPIKNEAALANPQSLDFFRNLHPSFQNGFETQ